MAQYINKDTLVAEIERLHKKWEMGNYVHEKLISFLNTLEVKEVDLEKEYDRYYEQERNIQTFKLAKHFFELGLKAQKG